MYCQANKDGSLMILDQFHFKFSKLASEEAYKALTQENCFLDLDQGFKLSAKN